MYTCMYPAKFCARGLSERSKFPAGLLTFRHYSYMACSSVNYLIALFPTLSLDFSFDLFIISEILLYAVVKLSCVKSLTTNVKSGTSFDRFDRTHLKSIKQY